MSLQRGQNRSTGLKHMVFPRPNFWEGWGTGIREGSIFALSPAKVALDLSQTPTIKRKITDEPAWVIVAGNFQEHKELPSVFSQLSFLLTSRDWSFAFKRNHAQHERMLLGSNVWCHQEKTKRMGFNVTTMIIKRLHDAFQ